MRKPEINWLQQIANSRPMTITIEIKKQGAGFSVWVNDECHAYGMSKEQVRFYTAGIERGVAVCGRRINSQICCEEYYAAKD